MTRLLVGAIKRIDMAASRRGRTEPEKGRTYGPKDPTAGAVARGAARPGGGGQCGDASVATPADEAAADPPVVAAEPLPGLFDVRPDGPLRPPDYRWQIARLMAAGVKVPAGWVDGWVRRAAETLAAENTHPAAAELAAVAAAREIAESGPELRRVEVEARLLAGQSPDVVAARAGLPVAVVEAYEALFYAVAERLRHRSFIIHLAVGLHTERADRDVGVHVRALGYIGGPLVLDAVLDAVRHPGPDESHDVSEEVRDRRKQVWLALKLRMTPVTARNAKYWIRLSQLMTELGSAPGGTG